jgi:hypothetical protein
VKCVSWSVVCLLVLLSVRSAVAGAVPVGGPLSATIFLPAHAVSKVTPSIINAGGSPVQEFGQSCVKTADVLFLSIIEGIHVACSSRMPLVDDGLSSNNEIAYGVFVEKKKEFSHIRRKYGCV